MSLKLKTLAQLREFRSGMDVTNYLNGELRQNWKALEQFISDVGEYSQQAESLLSSATTFQRSSTDLGSLLATSTSLTTFSTVNFDNTKSRVRCTLSPAKNSSGSRIILTTGSSNTVGLAIRIRETATNSIFYYGDWYTVITGSAAYAPVMFGDVDLGPGSYTFVVELARIGTTGVITTGLINYNFTIEEIL